MNLLPLEQTAAEEPVEFRACTTDLWEMLVPSLVTPQEGLTAWRREVCGLAGGMTQMLGYAWGSWLSPEGEVVQEQMTIVRVAASRPVMIAVAEATRRHFGQYSVSYYRVSDEFRRTRWDQNQ